jgi:uncharacterized protein
MIETVAILGASNNPYRYAYKAMLALADHGHKVLLVNPYHDQIDGTQCYQNLAACPGEVDTITVYVRPSILRGLLKDIADTQPRRIILNPGTEDPDINSHFQRVGIKVQNACTLVLLSTNQYIISN